MPIENEATTSTEETQSSAVQTDQSQASTQDKDSSSSTTETTEESVDLSKVTTGEETTETKEEVAETDEQKAEREAEEAKAADTAKLFGAPEGEAAYEIAGLPEGTTIDQAALDAIAPVARQLNLSNEGLSLIAQTYAEKVLPGVAEQVLGNLQNDIVAQRKDWETEARHAIKGVDAEGNKIELKNAKGQPISFDGKPYKEAQTVMAKALDQFAPVGFREFLDETGLGVHPMMVAFAYQAGKNIAEDTSFERGGSDAGQPKSRVEKYYPSSA